MHRHQSKLHIPDHFSDLFPFLRFYGSIVVPYKYNYRFMSAQTLALACCAHVVGSCEHVTPVMYERAANVACMRIEQATYT